MPTTKISVTLDELDVTYLDEETRSGRYPSRSAALQAAVRLLHESTLADAYAQAFAETSTDDWDTSVGDGLDRP